MDEAIVRALNAGASSSAIASAAVFLSSPWLLIAVSLPSLVYLIAKKRWIAIASIAFAMGSADAINARIVKPIVARERPCRAVADVTLPLSCGVGRSFASGHATVGGAMVLSAGSVLPYGFAILGPIAILVGLSRIVLAQHYASDVLGGFVLGSMIGVLFWRARVRLEKKRA